ncbi:MAG: DNA polymerase IV [Eubacteriales bacterium]|nr:DNA polymerase IV [Eubacteriales bacterium]
MERLIFHVDVNSAFLSWEAARRVANGEPDIRLIPSAIGGDPEKRTGVILAKSIPAKKFHVTTGEPVGMALRKCPDLVLAKPDFKLYERNSRAFIAICWAYAPVVEQFSIDECFLDMSGTHLVYPDPVKTAHEIKDKIRDTLGFTVNVGIGSNKLLAKMASDFEKPDKVHTLFPSEISQKMWPLPVRELFTVGRSTAEKLEKSRIRTIGDLAHTDLQRLERLVGVKMAQHIWNYANGIDHSPVSEEPEEAKGYGNSTTLADDVRTYDDAHKILLALCDSVTARMRSDGKKSTCVAVTIRSNDFKTRSHQKKLDTPTDITSEVYSLCKQLFRELWDGHTPLRLLGVALTNITDDTFEQASLFPEESREKARKMDKAIDVIRSKYGIDAISRGTSMQAADVGRKHKAQMELKQADEKENQ